MHLETDFLTAVLDPQAPHPCGLSDAQARPAGRRFDVYRNNVVVSLRDALIEGFPVLTKLLGAQNMQGLSALFLRQNPPASPLMMHYGAGFAEFLEGMEQLARYPYLGDVARLELALRRSYHAADHAPFDPSRLAALAPDTLLASRLTLAPSTELLPSRWPLYDIWRFNMVEGASQPGAQAQDVLITRPEFDPTPHALPPGGAAWLHAIQNNQTLAEATEIAQASAADFDLAPLLTLLIEGNAIHVLTE